MSDRRPIRQRLAEVYTEAELDRWIYSSHGQLDGRRPCDLVDGGQAEAVHLVIDRLLAGVHL
jgi:uncharacterized protein (DUF2384 family)